MVCKSNHKGEKRILSFVRATVWDREVACVVKLVRNTGVKYVCGIIVYDIKNTFTLFYAPFSYSVVIAVTQPLLPIAAVNNPMRTVVQGL